MNRSYERKDNFEQNSVSKIRLRTAVHEAGHAAAIYLGNKQRQLQPVFFQIVISEIPGNSQKSNHCLARVQGGRLIHSLTSSIKDSVRHFSQTQKEGYLKAFNADIVNLMVGPLAEANYVAMMDNEIINSLLVNFPALRFYGGASDIEVIEEYLDFYSNDATERKQKIDSLLNEAYAFINDRTYWRAIIALSQAIMASKKELVSYQEIAAILDRQSNPMAKIA